MWAPVFCSLFSLQYYSMKKIIAALDGLKYSKSTRDYAVHLAKQTNTHLARFFMDDITYTGYKIYELVS